MKRRRSVALREGPRRRRLAFGVDDGQFVGGGDVRGALLARRRLGQALGEREQLLRDAVDRRRDIVQRAVVLFLQAVVLQVRCVGLMCRQE